jgi:hypothetical protein
VNCDKSQAIDNINAIMAGLFVYVLESEFDGYIRFNQTAQMLCDTQQSAALRRYMSADANALIPDALLHIVQRAMHNALAIANSKPGPSDE